MKTVIKLSLLLALMLPATAIAHDFVVNGIYYNINGNESTVTYQGASATEVSNEYQGSVVIPATVTYNGTTYPVTAIGDSAFYQSSSLNSATIGNNVRVIGEDAFAACGFTTNITLGNSVTTIGDGAFYNCYSLKSITIPNSVITIDRYAFYNCMAATSLTLGNSVETIGYNAFYNCKKLTSLDIPNSVTTIGNFAFNKCVGLTSVTIGTGVTSLGDLVFYECSALETLNYNAVACNDFHSVGGAFSGTPISTLNIGSTVQKIPNGFVKELKQLTSVDIPNSVTSIGEEAFYGCTGLTSLTLGSSVRTIGYYAFYKCSGLTSVVIPNSVTTIDHRAFTDCSSLIDVTIGTGVTSIGNSAFEGCTALETVNYNAIACNDMNDTPFDIQSPLTINIGDGVQRIPSRFAEGLMKLTSITFPNTVTQIGLAAFLDCTGLTSVTFGNSLTTIGVGAFCNTRLTSVDIPNSVTTMEFQAFADNAELTTVTIGSSATHFGSFVFQNCPSIETVTCAATTPPDWEGPDVFMDEVYENAPLYVPEGSLNDYKNDRGGWGQFTRIRAIGIGQIFATSIDIYFTNVRLKIGQKFRLSVTVLPEDTEDKRVSWSSSDSTVVSVDDNGMVTAHAVGTAVITATTMDGSNLSDTCTIRVIAEQGDVSGDGTVNIADVTALINILLTGGEAPAAADVDGDGIVNIKDVTALINKLLSSGN